MRKIINVFKLHVCPNHKVISIDNYFYLYLGFFSLSRNEIGFFQNLATMLSNGFVNFQGLLCAELVHGETLRVKC